jgi:uncharacterized protein (DUF3820 family)
LTYTSEVSAKSLQLENTKLFPLGKLETKTICKKPLLYVHYFYRKTPPYGLEAVLNHLSCQLQFSFHSLPKTLNQQFQENSTYFPRSAEIAITTYQTTATTKIFSKN